MKLNKIISKLFFSVSMVVLLFSFATFAEGPTKEADGTYYLNAKGLRVLDEWVKFNDKWYRTNNQGKILTGFFIDPADNRKYFLDTNDGASYGMMVENGVHIIDGYYYIFSADGSILKSNELKNTDIGNGFTIDSEGKVYSNGTLMEDVSVNRSEFYSDENNARNPAFNNYLLWTYRNAAQANMNTSGIIGPGAGGAAGPSVIGPDGTASSGIIGPGGSGGGGGGGGSSGGGGTNTNTWTAEERRIVNDFKKQYIKSGMSDFEKEMQIIQWMIENIEYDYDSYQNGTIPRQSYESYGAIVNKKAVCDGYSKAFQKIAQDCGLTVNRVSGTANGMGSWEGHSWNQIRLDGEWYNVDVTWEDPVPTNSYKFGNLRNAYINITDDKLAENHRWSGGNKCTNYKYGKATAYIYLKTNEVVVDKNEHISSLNSYLDFALNNKYVNSFKTMADIRANLLGYYGFFNTCLDNVFTYEDRRNYLNSENDKEKVLNYVKDCLNKNNQFIVWTSSKGAAFNKESYEYFKQNADLSEYRTIMDSAGYMICKLDEKPARDNYKYFSSLNEQNKSSLKSYLNEKIEEFKISSSNTTNIYVAMNDGADTEFFTSSYIADDASFSFYCRTDVMESEGFKYWTINLSKIDDSGAAEGDDGSSGANYYNGDNVEELKNYLTGRVNEEYTVHTEIYIRNTANADFITTDWLKNNINSNFAYEIIKPETISQATNYWKMQINRLTLENPTENNVKQFLEEKINEFSNSNLRTKNIILSVKYDSVLDYFTAEWISDQISVDFRYSISKVTGNITVWNEYYLYYQIRMETIGSSYIKYNRNFTPEDLKNAIINRYFSNPYTHWSGFDADVLAIDPCDVSFLTEEWCENNIRNDYTYRITTSRSLGYDSTNYTFITIRMDEIEETFGSSATPSEIVDTNDELIEDIDIIATKSEVENAVDDDTDVITESEEESSEVANDEETDKVLSESSAENSESEDGSESDVEETSEMSTDTLNSNDDNENGENNDDENENSEILDVESAVDGVADSVVENVGENISENIDVENDDVLTEIEVAKGSDEEIEPKSEEIEIEDDVEEEPEADEEVKAETEEEPEADEEVKAETEEEPKADAEADTEVAEELETEEELDTEADAEVDTEATEYELEVEEEQK